MGSMFREEQKASDRQQNQKCNAHSRRQEAAFWLRLPVRVVMM
jgi:hypothetical protein